jgi:hypothetical protein
MALSLVAVLSSTAPWSGRAAVLSTGGRTGPPPIPPVLAANELGPIQQNAVIKGRDGAQSGLFQGTAYWTFGDTVLAVPGHDGDSWADNTLSWTSDLDGATASR